MTVGARLDVVVVGGGPGGSVAAATLARAGLSVLVLERETVPRWKVGESLLPCTFDVLDGLGLPQSVFRDAGFVSKKRAEFHDAATGEHRTFSFFETLRHTPHNTAFHVERSKFDAILLDHARRCGAQVRDGTAVAGVETDEDGARVRLASGEQVLARFVVDSSGQATLLGRGPSKRALPGLDRGAVWAHYEGVALDPGLADGNIRIVLEGLGWFWLIPLETELSVGAVVPPEEMRGRERARVLDDRVARSPSVAALLATGRRTTDVFGHASWSYAIREASGERHVLVGDALGFVDPIFSTGVHLAVVSGQLASEVVIAALARGALPTREDFAAYARHMDRAHEVVNQLVLSFYDGGLLKTFVFNKHPMPELEQALTEVLAGDFWSESNPFLQKVHHGRRGKDRPRIEE